MNLCKFAVVFVAVVLVASTSIEAKKKHKSKLEYPSSRSKIKTKWSSSAEVEPNGSNSMVATEEHGYYVKRTYQPLNASATETMARRSPPYLAIPIAWFSCQGDACLKSNSVAINGQMNAINEGFLCADDCVEPYSPICGRTPSEVAVFYNMCKLNVAKCRSHGLWQDFAYEECKHTYPKEVACTEKKFKSSPFFVDSKDVATSMAEMSKDRETSEDDSILEAALEALNEIGDKLVEAESDDDSDSDNDNDSDSSSDSESTSASETGSKAEAETEMKNETDMKTETKAETDMKTGMKTGTKAETDMKTGMKTETKAGTDMKTGMKTETETKVETKTEPQMVAKTEKNAEILSQTETKKMAENPTQIGTKVSTIKVA